jgi:hypothetical protein
VLTLASLVADLFDHLVRAQSAGGFATIVVPLLALLVAWTYVAAALGYRAAPVAEPPFTFDRRLYVGRSSARRRAWTPVRGENETWSSVAVLRRMPEPRRPSPAITRFRVRRTIRHLSPHRSIIRYPY